MFNVHDPHGIVKLFTRLRVGLSHLRQNTFRHNFQDFLNPFGDWGRHIETSIHFFFYCSNYWNQRKSLFDEISNIKHTLLNQNDSAIAEIFLFGSNGLNDKKNTLITESRIEYIKVHTSIAMNPFKQIKSPIIFFSWYVIQNLYIYIDIYIHTHIYVYIYIYMYMSCRAFVCNLFFVTFFISLLCKLYS